MKIKLLLLFLFYTILSCSQSKPKSIDEVLIDKSIELKVKKELEKHNRTRGLYIEYEPEINPNIDIDSVAIRDIENQINSKFGNKGIASFYFIDGDSIHMQALPDFRQSFSFEIKIKGNTFNSNALFTNGIIYEFSANELDKTDENITIKIKTLNPKLILSKYPKKLENDFLYGYLEFESEYFFINRQNYDLIKKENKTKHKIRTQVYFKSIYIKRK